MSWTYISGMDEYDKLVTKDSSTLDRYTFNRYMYFKPDQYDNWSKGQSYDSIPYTAELVGNSIIPSAGTRLNGSLSSFYVNDIKSIRNLSEEEHGDACSYAVVTIEYENIAKSGGGGGSSSSQTDDNLPPWERHVDDFTITNLHILVPLRDAFVLSGPLSAATQIPVSTLTTTAGQPLYGYTAEIYRSHISWTFYEHDHTHSYQLMGPILNLSTEIIGDGDGLAAFLPGHGLLMPPQPRYLYYTDEKRGYKNEPYTLWKFEVIGSQFGFHEYVINAGTKFLLSGTQQDICSWYVYNPTSGTIPERIYGSFKDMMDAKKEVDEYNKTKTNLNLKKIWNGDFVQEPVPLNVDGSINRSALLDPTKIKGYNVLKFPRAYWRIGFR